MSFPCPHLPGHQETTKGEVAYPASLCLTNAHTLPVCRNIIIMGIKEKIYIFEEWSAFATFLTYQSHILFDSECFTQ